ncbi:MAG: histidinol-phosphate transaminase [Candidatus Pelagibacter sp.]|tara:strand:- start:100 stop:1182 length:1083 start_codon:yes stop_codon:yes gene_type:complete
MQKVIFRKIGVTSYKPGRSVLLNKKKVIKLSANESALGFSSRVKKKLSKIGSLSKYPDSESKSLRKEISKKFNCNFDQIICGSGSDEIIQMICQLFLKKSDEVIVPKFSFLMYRIYSGIVGAKIVYSIENNFKVSVNDILKKVTRKTKIVFLANPNNPTATYLSALELKDLRKKLRSNILLVVDDAYEEYMLNKDYESGLNLFKNKNNVFILRTFSKIYGLASLRVGWGYGSKEIVKALMKIKPPFNVTKIGELSALESLKDKKFIAKSIKHNKKWAEILKSEFEKLNINTNEVSANFLLLNFDRCKISAEKFKKKLEEKGIIVRSLEVYGIKNKLRLTIGNSKENNFLIKILKSIFSNV